MAYSEPVATMFNSSSKVAVAMQQEAVNLNPEAQDCYFYFYSTCSKVSGGSERDTVTQSVLC